MRIIPAIDLIDGKCVRLTQGDYSAKKIYNDSPLEVAKQFEDAGIHYLHLVDLDGAKAGQIKHYEILEAIATKTNLQVDFGGGIQSDEAVKIAFESGAQQITVGSLAVRQPEIFVKWLQQYGPERIILGADVSDNKIATNAWQEQSDRDVFEFLEAYIAQNVKYAVCTDVAKDGMLAGPALELYNQILERFSLNLIASGGISSLEDLQKLKAIGCEGAIIGKAIYDQKITLKELEALC